MTDAAPTRVTLLLVPPAAAGPADAADRLRRAVLERAGPSATLALELPADAAQAAALEAAPWWDALLLEAVARGAIVLARPSEVSAHAPAEALEAVSLPAADAPCTPAADPAPHLAPRPSEPHFEHWAADAFGHLNDVVVFDGATAAAWRARVAQWPRAQRPAIIEEQ